MRRFISREGRKGAEKGATATAALVDPTMNLIKESLPYGDEPWVNQEPGLDFGRLLELDPRGVKALEEAPENPVLQPNAMVYVGEIQGC